MNNQNNDVHHALTVKWHHGLTRVLSSDIQIAKPTNPTRHPFKAIWDTGASASVITQSVVDALDLLPVSYAVVNTASQTGVQTPVYIVDIWLKVDLVVQRVPVTLGKITDEFSCLIGMDIIGLGDFSVTNHQNKTCMSFRIPSAHEVDYVQTPKMGVSTVGGMHLKPIPSRNQICACGSNKKYKHCCGKGA